MFKKLDIKLPRVDIERLKGPGGSVGEVSEAREYRIKDIQYLKSLLISKINLHIPPSSANITIIEKSGGTSPHTDEWPTALNFYLDISGAGNEVTTFYENPSNHKIIIKDLRGVYKYDMDQLIKCDSFVANQDDCYLLNTHIPHNVSNNFNGSRTLLRLIWHYHDFDTVLRSIKIL